VIRALVPKMPTTDELIPYLRKIEDSKWYSNFGPLNDQLALRLSEYFGVPAENICLIANATLGLQAVAESIKVQSSLIFELPAFTFAAGPSALISARRKFKFIDVDPEMRCTPTSSAKVVMDVLPFGEAIRVESWMNSLDFLIVDAAASFDALRNFGRTTNFGCDYALIVSLHSTKLLGAGEGGVVISSDVELIKDIKLWQNFGFDIKGNSKRESLLKGTNAKMSEFNCAVGLASLDKWEEVRSMYLKIQNIAREISIDSGLLTHTAMQNGWVNPYWVIVPREKEITRRVRNLCEDSGFETRLWWEFGCNNMPAFSEFQTADLTITKSICETYLGLPFHLYLDEKYWIDIREILKKATN
jgi:dTDP-4-amino-4,6-dideoxygalactose transaminase